MAIKERAQLAAGLKVLLARLSAVFYRAPSPIRKSKAPDDTMGAPIVHWPGPDSVEPQAISCPNCGSDVPKPLLLTIDFATLPGSRRETTVLRCPSCTCPFYASQVPPDYAEDAMLERGRVPFYLQQGAGLSLITRPLAQLRAPAGSAYVEVGCGFGFGLDYARHAKGWAGHGIDPGAISRLGQDMLGVTIHRRYLQDSEPTLEATCDVVMASETIEHVRSPKTFVRVLRGMLRPGGTLILTTPDAADLRPETAPGVLIGLLSPGLHLIFQSRESLCAMLEECGFGHVLVAKDGHSLVAFASDRPLDLESDRTVLRREYRRYLARRARDFPPRHDLLLAFAGRALLESVNDGAFDEARNARTDVQRACKLRFGRSLDGLAERATAKRGASVEQLSRCMPLSLGGLLYADAILRLASGDPRADLGKRFLRAAEAADRLRDALAELALADGMSEEISWTARAEALLCAAASGADDIVDRLSALPLAPDAEQGAKRREVIAERALVELVNAGHYQLATALSAANKFDARAWADPDNDGLRSDSQRDALFCLAVLDSQSVEPPRIERSRARFHRVLLCLGDPDDPRAPGGLFEAARRGETAARNRLDQHISTVSASLPEDG
jgi:SAM-dependent methyltransferase